MDYNNYVCLIGTIILVLRAVTLLSATVQEV